MTQYRLSATSMKILLKD